MATATETVVNTVSVTGSVTTGSTFYTVPSGRYAEVEISYYKSTSGNLIIGFAGGTSFNTSGNDIDPIGQENTGAKRFYLPASGTLTQDLDNANVAIFIKEFNEV